MGIRQLHLEEMEYRAANVANFRDNLLQSLALSAKLGITVPSPSPILDVIRDRLPDDSRVNE
jgi:hypothetical protein